MTDGLLVPSVNQGRYAVDDAVDGPDLTSGRSIDLWDETGRRWVSGVIEHGRSGYYFDAFDQSGMVYLRAGLRVRLT